MSKFLIIGHGAREYAIAKKLVDERQSVLIAMGADNAGLEAISDQRLYVKDYSARQVVRFARRHNVDYIFPGTESPIFKGITDIAERIGIPTLAPTKAFASLETNKLLAKAIAAKVDPNIIPSTVLCASIEEAKRTLPILIGRKVLKATKKLGNQNVCVLTGVSDKDAALASQFFDGLGANTPIIIEDYIEGEDFSIYAFTDGEKFFFSKSIKDYPFRYDNDLGPKTGGMGTVSHTSTCLPYLDKADYEQACKFAKSFLHKAFEYFGHQSLGVFSIQFLKTANGIMFNEIDIRPGDPEMVNLILNLRSPLCDVIAETICKDLKAVRFNEEASVAKYFVHPNYPTPTQHPIQFSFNQADAESNGCEIFFGNCALSHGSYETRTARTLVIAAAGPSIEACGDKINSCAKRVVQDKLSARSDIGIFKYHRLRQR